MTRILIVDDKPESLYLLRTLLEANQCQVDEACHGADALIKAHAQVPDLIVSDLLMPVMDGYTLLRQWKEEERLKAIPFIVYTATYTDPQDERLALDLGADAFILKPAEPDALLAQVKDVLARAQRGEIASSSAPRVGAHVLATKYSQVLVHKLEEKALQLEKANRALHEDLERRRHAEDAAAQAHTALLQSMERIREQAMLLDIATDGILVLDPQHQILFWNKGCERLYGWSAEEALGKPCSELLVPDSTVFAAACAALLRDGRWTGELHQLTKDREELTVLSRWSLLRDAQGHPKSVLVINTDVTERKQLEAQLFRAQRLESIGQLASGIAHDLNNILAPLAMITPLLRSEMTNPATLRLIDMIEANTKRGAEVVKQVLTFSRGLKTGKGPVPLRPLLKEVGAMLNETLPKSIRVQVTAPENLWMIEGDPTQIHQVLMNLCVNARDAMPEGGVLSVEAEDVNVGDAFAALIPGAKPGSYVALLVADTGMGIPPENMDRIFDPFFTTKEPGKGTGLGLSTVLGIVRDHGGFIRVESKPGKGTQFRIYLPATLCAEPAPALDEAAVPHGHGETILLVDDEESVRMTTRKILERFGYHVLVACEGSEAVMVFAQHSHDIHVVLTDLVMPLMDGPSLIRALHKASPDVKIVAVTGAAETAQSSAARRLGVQALLQKPYSSAVLLQTMRAVLDGQVLAPAGDSAAPFSTAATERSTGVSPVSKGSP